MAFSVQLASKEPYPEDQSKDFGTIASGYFIWHLCYQPVGKNKNWFLAKVPLGVTLRIDAPEDRREVEGGCRVPLHSWGHWAFSPLSYPWWSTVASNRTPTHASQ